VTASIALKSQAKIGEPAAGLRSATIAVRADRQHKAASGIHFDGLYAIAPARFRGICSVARDRYSRDQTGVRLRRIPFRPPRVLAELRAARI